MSDIRLNLNVDAAQVTRLIAELERLQATAGRTQNNLNGFNNIQLNNAMQEIRRLQQAIDELRRAQNDQSSGNNNTTASFGRLGAILPGVAAGVMAVGTAMGVAGIAAIVMADNVSNARANLIDLSDMTSISVETLSSWKLAADLGGVSLDDLGDMAVKLHKSISAASDVTSEQAQAFKLLGINTKDTTLTTEDYMKKAAVALDGMNAGWQKNEVMATIFGKSGPKMNQVLQEIAASGEGVVTVTRDMAEQSDEYEKSKVRLSGQIQKYKDLLTDGLLPTMKDVVNVLLEATTNSTLFDQANKEAVKSDIDGWARKGALGLALLADGFIGLRAATKDMGKMVGNSWDIIRAEDEIITLRMKDTIDVKNGKPAGGNKDEIAKLTKKIEDLKSENGVMFWKSQPTPLYDALEQLQYRRDRGIADDEDPIGANPEKEVKKTKEDILKENAEMKARADKIKADAEALKDAKAKAAANASKAAAEAAKAEELALKAAMVGIKASIDTKKAMYEKELDDLQGLYDDGLRDRVQFIDESEKLKKDELVFDLAYNSQALVIAQSKGEKGKAEYERLLGERRQYEIAVTAADAQAIRDRKAYARDVKKALEELKLAGDYRLEDQATNGKRSNNFTDSSQTQYDANYLSDILKQQRRDKAAKTKDMEDKGYTKKDADDALDVLKEQQASELLIAQDTINERIRGQGDWMNGARRSMNEYLDMSQNVAAQSGEAFGRAFQGMEDAMTNFAMTGKLNFTGLAQSVIADIIRMQAKAATSGIMSMVVKVAGAYMSGQYTASNNAIGAAQGLSASDIGSAFASGGGIDRGVKMFANGGEMLHGPKFFPMANGMGLAGEAGPEAIMPAKRMANGNLGVQVSGMGGGTNITNNVTVNVTAGKDADETANKTREATMKAMQQIADQQIVAANRIGGINNGFSTKAY